MRRRCWAFVSGCLLLTGCGELGGDVIELPRAEAVERFYFLAGPVDLMDLPLKHGMSSARLVDRTAEGVTWTFMRKGEPVCRLTIHVKEETSTTSVIWTDVEKVAQYDDNGLCAALDIVGNESVAAVIEGRAANRERAAQQIDALAE